MFNPVLSADWEVGQRVAGVKRGVTAGALDFYTVTPESLLILMQLSLS